jgi:hypothetical protein
MQANYNTTGNCINQAVRCRNGHSPLSFYPYGGAKGVGIGLSCKTCSVNLFNQYYYCNICNGAYCQKEVFK